MVIISATGTRTITVFRITLVCFQNDFQNSSQRKHRCPSCTSRCTCQCVSFLRSLPVSSICLSSSLSLNFLSSSPSLHNSSVKPKKHTCTRYIYIFICHLSSHSPFMLLCLTYQEFVRVSLCCLHNRCMLYIYM